MSGTKDVRTTSFGGDDDRLNLGVTPDPPSTDERDECQQQSNSSVDTPLSTSAKPSGLMTAVGDAIGDAIKHFRGQSQDSDFVDICKKASKTLTKLHSKHGEIVFPDELLQAMIKTNEVLDSKDICISIFGQHNCGKSTLLNALIGEELLPVYAINETSVEIKVQHDSNIHQGICVRNCQNQHGSCQQSKSCPKLQVTFKGGKEEIKGAEAIYDYLTKLNRKLRQADHETPVVVLNVNIPLLAGRVPAGWTVSLVDNPGFGEAKEHIVQLAHASLVTSSAYIYLLQTDDIGGTGVADFFKELATNDKSSLTDGRLSVGVTKFDNIYSNKSRKSKGREQPTGFEHIREVLIASIKEATKNDNISEGTIIPLCGKWAMAASRLASCLISDPTDEKQERLSEAAKILENYPHLCLPGGQEQSPRDAIMSLQPKDLIDHLETASGVADLKPRIHYVVGKACVKIWATKINSEFNKYLEAGEKGIEERCEYLKKVIKEKRNDAQQAQKGYNKILSSKEEIRGTAPGKKKRETLLWKKFERSYGKDLEESKPQEKGKRKVRDLVKEFRDQCQARIASKRFSPADFENSIQEFLNDSGLKLQEVFDSSCGFWNIQYLLMEHIEKMVEDITKLRSNARLLCKMDPEEVDPNRSRTTSKSEGRVLSAPNLADIRLKVKIPSVSLRWWEKIINLFRKLHGNASSEVENERDEKLERDDQLNEGSCCSSVPQIESPSASSCNQINASLTSKEHESESDPEEDCDKYQDTFMNSKVDLGAVPLSTNKCPLSSTIESGSITSHCSTPAAEDETDGGRNNKQDSSKQIKPYRKWTQELEDALCVLQQNMEIECDIYFKDIMPKAIRFFYEDYSQRTRDRLDAFNKDFKRPLEQELRRIKELERDIESLQKEEHKLHTKKDDVNKLAKQLLEAYSVEFANLDNK